MAQGCTEADAQLERQDREAFVDFLLGVLDMDPATRWTPRQVPQCPVSRPLCLCACAVWPQVIHLWHTAVICLVSSGAWACLLTCINTALRPAADALAQALLHPFINTGVQFTGPFQPPPDQHPPGLKAMQRQQEDAYRMTGSVASVLPSPGATALLATSPQAHEQAHAVAVAAMAQLSPQLGSQLLQQHYTAHGAGGLSLPAPRLAMPGTSPPQTVARLPSTASYGGGATWGQSRQGAGLYGSPQPSEVMQQSVVGGGGDSSMFSPVEPAASGLQHSSGSGAQVSSELVLGEESKRWHSACASNFVHAMLMPPGDGSDRIILACNTHIADQLPCTQRFWPPVQAATVRQYMLQQAALDQHLEQQRQQRLASDAAALSSACAASGVGGFGAGTSVPVGSMARSLPGLRGQQTHYGSYTTGATALSALQQQAYLNQMLVMQQQATAESASYRSPQHMLRSVDSTGGGSYAVSSSSYDAYQSPKRSARQSGGAAGPVQASPYSMLSPAAAAGRQYSHAASAGGYAGSSGAYRRSSYSSQIPHVPEDEPLPNFDTAGLTGGPASLSRRPSGRNGSEGASMPDPAEWDPLYRCTGVPPSPHPVP